MRPFLFLALFCASSAHAKSVYDYFLALPVEKLSLIADSTGKPLTTAELKKSIKVRDDKNGYLEMAHPDVVGGKFTVALFKKKNGDPLIAVHRDGEVTASQTLTFLEPKKDGGWDDVTAKVMPKIDEKDVEARIRKASPAARAIKHSLYDYAGALVLWRLPRKGTDIKAVCGYEAEGINGVEIFTMKFDGEKFTVRP